MAQVVAFEVQVGGLTQVITNMDQLRAAVKATNTEFNQAERGTEEYQRLQRQLGLLQNEQKAVRAETRNAGREAVIQADAGRGSYRALNAELVNARMRFKELTAAERAGEIGQRTLQNIQRLDSELKQIDASIGQFQRNVGNYRQGLLSIGDLVTGGLITGGLQQLGQEIADGVRQSVEAFNAQEKAITAVGQAVAQTGQAAGLALDELVQEAGRLQSETIFGDEEILQGVTSQLLTFTNIAGEQFLRTQQAALDLSTVLDGDLQSSAIQLGKALNDPVANLSALSRSGIQFSTQQKEVIRDLQESGRLAEAQTVILDELNRQYGGQSQAAATTFAGAVQQIRNEFGDALEVVGQFIANGIQPLLPLFRNFVRAIQDGLGFLGNAFAPAGEALAELRSTLSGVGVTADSLAESFRTRLGGTVNFLANLFRRTVQFVNFLIESFQSAANSGGLIGRVFTQIGNSVQLTISLFSNFGNVLNGLLEAGVTLAQGFARSFTRIQLSARILFNDLRGLVDESARNTAASLRQQRDALAGSGETVGEAFRRGFDQASEVDLTPPDSPALRRDYSSLGTGLGETLANGIAEGLGENLPTALEALRAAQSELAAALQNAILNGEDYAELQERWLANQEMLNRVTEQFADIQNLATEEAQKTIAAIGSISTLTLPSLEFTAAPQTLEEALAEIQAQLDRALTANNQLEQSDEDRIANRERLEAEAQDRILQTRLDRERLSSEQRAALERELSDLRIQEEERVQTAIEERRKLALENLQEGIKQITDNINTIAEIAQTNLDTNTARQVQNIEERYDREIELAEGNSAAIERLEMQRDAEIEEIEREAFERSKRIQIASALAQSAQGVVNILSAPSTIPDPFGAVFKTAQIALLIARTQSQIQAIRAQTFAAGGFTGSGIGSPDHTGQRPAGTVHENEYVVDRRTLATKQGRAHVAALEKIRLRGGHRSDNARPGFFESGGLTTPQLMPNVSGAAGGGSIMVNARAGFTTAQIREIAREIATVTGASVREGTVQAMEEAEANRIRQENLNARTS